mgnify:CR=1 FL=1
MQKSLNERKDIEFQISSMTSEIAHLIGRLAIAKQITRQGEICLSFIPYSRQLGDQVLQKDTDWII